jgi:hypothetical protein
MSQQNIEAVRPMYAAFSDLAQSGDCASYVAAYWDPDGEYHPVEEIGTIRGHDALVAGSRAGSRPGTSSKTRSRR